ncbi:hypothetical protein HanRHA438_Chr17g0803631 [Helianthus annuus]|nr:hypothetical protein HanRHA438_Chr17g0803631 [Helianthus annuus]
MGPRLFTDVKILGGWRSAAMRLSIGRPWRRWTRRREPEITLDMILRGHVMVCEFLASFEFTPRPADKPEEDEDPKHLWVEVSFRLGGQWHEMSLGEFVVHSGIYTLEETDTPIYTEGVHVLPHSTLVRFWQVIGWGRFGRSKSRVSYIRDPLFRYLHRLITTSIHRASRVASGVIKGICFICFVLYERRHAPSITA